MYNKQEAACGMSKHPVDPPVTAHWPLASLRIREASHTLYGALATACLLLLAACSSGGGGENPIFGSDGQQPDPATVDFAVAYVKRTLPQPPDELQDDARELRPFNVDADLYLKDRASPSVAERNITQRVTGDTDEWDVKDVEASYDGHKLIFAMRGPMISNADEEDQPTWNVWEYDLPSDALHRVIASDILAEEGHDVAPHYLPDGRIVFSSTRQRQSKAILLDEGKPQFAAQDEDRNEPSFVLHVMDADGSNVHQISFNQSHDHDPTVLVDGRVLFSRWDHAPGHNAINLYTMNPDGTGLELLYGAQTTSHATGFNDSVVQFLQPRPLENGRTLALLRPFQNTEFGADIISIDTQNYVEVAQRTLAGVTANVPATGPAQERVVINDVRAVPNTPSPGGLFSAAYPLFDGSNRMFVSWSLCRVLESGNIVPCTSDRLNNPNVQAAPSSYGIWIYDFATDTQLPVVPPEEGMMITDVVAMKPRTLPAVILDGVSGVDLDADLVNENAGLIDIRSVYDFDGVETARRTDGTTATIPTLANPTLTTADQRPARFLRIEKAVSIPDQDTLDFRNTAFGASNFMREILAYAMVEPDGSVRIKVPANVAFQISVLDKDGRRLPQFSRHNNWMQARPGEVLRCNGCHNPAGGTSHGRSNLFASIYPGSQTPTLPFPNTEPAFFTETGETMAQTRARTSCANDTPRCMATNPSVNVVYDDIWTDPATAGRAKDTSFSYRYADLTTPAPTSSACQTAWSSACRIVVNYEQHIQPLWDKPRLILDPIDPTIVIANHTCTNNGCHVPRDAMAQLAVPAGQLDLTGQPSNEVPDRFISYQELLFTDTEQEVNMGALQDRLVPGPPDANGNPTQVTVQVPASMSAGGARASGRFFSRFDANVGTVDHQTFLTPAEKRLIAEWLDIGAQYYNNPFAAPLN